VHRRGDDEQRTVSEEYGCRAPSRCRARP
jgi:hypothetical protein